MVGRSEEVPNPRHLSPGGPCILSISCLKQIWHLTRDSSYMPTAVCVLLSKKVVRTDKRLFSWLFITDPPRVLPRGIACCPNWQNLHMQLSIIGQPHYKATCSFNALLPVLYLLQGSLLQPYLLKIQGRCLIPGTFHEAVHAFLVVSFYLFQISLNKYDTCTYILSIGARHLTSKNSLSPHR